MGQSSSTAQSITHIHLYLEADVSPPPSPSLSRMAPGHSPAGCPGLEKLSSVWQAAGGSSMPRRKLNYRSCCTLCKQDKSQWYGQLHFKKRCMCTTGSESSHGAASRMESRMEPLVILFVTLLSPSVFNCVAVFKLQ